MTDPTPEEDEVRDAFRQAIAFHQEGQLIEADSQYGKVLELDPTGDFRHP